MGENNSFQKRGRPLSSSRRFELFMSLLLRAGVVFVAALQKNSAAFPTPTSLPELEEARVRLPTIAEAGVVFVVRPYDMVRNVDSTAAKTGEFAWNMCPWGLSKPRREVVAVQRPLSGDDAFAIFRVFNPRI